MRCYSISLFSKRVHGKKSCYFLIFYKNVFFVFAGDPPILTPANDIVVAGGPILTQELSPKVQPIVVEAPVAPTVVSSAPEVVVAQPPQSVITQPPAPEFEEDAQEDEKEEVEIIAPAPAATTTTATTTTNNEINSEAIEVLYCSFS